MSIENGDTANIDLIDFWRLLRRHRALFLGVFLLTAIVGAAIAVLYPKSYRYSMTIQVGGTRIQDAAFNIHGVTQLFESPETLKFAIVNDYLPTVIADNGGRNPEWVHYIVDVVAADKGDSVLITTKGHDEQYADINDLYQELGEKISEIENRNIKKQIQLTIGLLEQRQHQLEVQIDASLNSRKVVMERGSDANKAFTVLMLNNEIDQEQKELNAVTEQLQVGIPAGIRFTEPAGKMVRSIRPIGLPPILVMALSGLLGIFFGGIAVALVELRHLAKKRGTP